MSEPADRASTTESAVDRADESGTLFERILPQTALGLAVLLFFMSIAAAFSGAALFAYYRYELDQTEREVARVESEIADEVAAAGEIIDGTKDDATAEIEALLSELEQFAASGQTLGELIENTKESVYFVSTLDADGQPSVGTAFVLFSDSERSFLITSYTTVAAATASPGPGVTVRNGDDEIAVELTTWDEGRDLALLIADNRPNLPAIPVAGDDPMTGQRVFAFSGLGAQGASVVQGVIADAAANGITHDAPIGVQFQGGPLLNAQGELIGIASRTYSPPGFVPETVFFAVPVRGACEQVVQCPSNLGGS